MKIQITNARPADARRIQMVFNKTWLTTYSNRKAGITVADIKHRQRGSLGRARLKKRRDGIRNLPRNERYLTAKHGVLVVGVCIVSKQKTYNKLNAIYVLPRYQGRGIGRMLWEEAKTFLNRKRKTVVRVATYNKSAQAFYNKLGFRTTGKRFFEERYRLKSGAIIPEIEMVMRRMV